MRKGLLNAFLESNLDANFFEIINLKSSGSVQGGTTYVDSMAVDDESGEPGAAAPFKTIGAALAATPDGYNIVVRPGTYTWSGFINVDKSVKMFGYGAIISPVTTHHAGLLVSAPDVQIHGFEFDGGFISGVSDDDTDGCIAVTGAGLVMVDLSIHNQHNVGIELRSGYDGVRIQGCGISTCFRAITSEVVSNTAGVNIINNGMALNRQGAIYLNGNDNVSIFRLIRIVHNQMFSNDTANQHSAVISFPGGGRDISIIANQISDAYDGINLTKTLRASIEDNHIVGCTNNIINIIGHKRLRISGNLLDGAHPTTDAAVSTNGIVLSGDYDTANDSSHAIITDNTISNIQTGGNPIDAANFNKAKISLNYFDGTAGTVATAAFTFLTISDNSWNIASNDIPITLDAAERGWSNASISGNRFNVSSPTRLIGTSDLGGIGQNDLAIVGNSSTAGKTYANGTVSNVAGTAPTNQRIRGNSPIATGGPTTGWINDDDPVQQNTVFVSQLRGNNATASRENKAHPYLTINVAILAATSGDTVYVLDGVFDEFVAAKDGIVVRFMPEATLACTTANGCLTSTADGEVFELFHEHAPISSAKAGGVTVWLTDTGFYHIHADIVNTGTNTGTVAHAVRVDDSAHVYIYGSVFSANGNCFSAQGAGTPAIIVYPVYGRHNTQIDVGPHLWADLGSGASLSQGSLDISDCLIYGGGLRAALLSCDVTLYRFTRCKFLASGTAAPAVAIATTGDKEPIFIDCILQSESTATGSITTVGAQTVRIMGSVMANKGADPPTNITFTGGGIYTVDAGVLSEFD